MDDNASATESQEASSHARATSSGQSSTCHFDFYERTTRAFPQEGLDQNFVDEEAKEKGESRRSCSKKRLKSADSTMDDQVVPSMKAELQQVCKWAALMQEKKKQMTVMALRRWMLDY